MDTDESLRAAETQIPFGNDNQERQVQKQIPFGNDKQGKQVQQEGQGRQQKAQTQRVTQGFVGTLQWCWRRPGLTALEVMWRWVYGVPALWLLRREVERVLLATPLDYAGLREMTLLDPVRCSVTLAKALQAVAPAVRGVAVWLGPLLVVGWIVVSSLGRTVVLRRGERGPEGAAGNADGVAGGAAGGAGRELRGVVAVPARGGGAGDHGADCAGRGAEPGALLCAGDCGDLGVVCFMGSGELGLAVAPLLAMQRGTGVWASLRAAFGLGALRIKLVEINLVMGIVKIALLVLATVFSASPLPFETVASREFLTWWWVGVTVWYLVASDFFHVARLVSYLGLLREA